MQICQQSLEHLPKANHTKVWDAKPLAYGQDGLDGSIIHHHPLGYGRRAARELHCTTCLY